jgi:hypothetical protein
MRGRAIALVILAALAGPGRATALAGQAQMPDPKAIAGIPLPDPALPAGTISVRVIQGDFSKNVPGQPVEFIVDGRSEILRTGEDGRVQRAGLPTGARVKAVAQIGGERLESQEVVVGAGGIRIVLVAAD